MSPHRVVSRKLAGLLLHPDFIMCRNRAYPNSFGRLGQRLTGTLDGTQFFFSQSDTLFPANVTEFANVLAYPDWIDESKSVVYPAHRRGGVGIRIEAWSHGKWYHIFIPITCVQLLHPLIAEILEFARKAG